MNYRANALGWPKSAYETSRTYALADQADAYAPQGALGHAVLGSLVTLTNSYQNRLQPNTLSATAGGNTLMSRTYDFHRNSGNNGNVYGITDNLDALNIANRPTGSATFTYDALNRLTQAKSTGTDCTQLPGATKNWGNSYSLDPWGNLINKGVPSPNLPGCLAESLSEIVGVDNRFTGAGRYDASGNMTQNGAYVYDAENRLKTAAATTYTYDGDGNRAMKTGATNMIYWRGAGADALAEGSSSNLTAEYIFFGGKRVARVDNPGASETVHYYISDHLGSATVIASSSGAVEEEEMYFPYGGERWANGSDGNHYKFTGKERDAETGLDYFGARYYGSNKGRFTAVDPTMESVLLGKPQTWNRYTYVLNNPLAFIDPDGELWVSSGNKDNPYSWVDKCGKGQTCYTAIASTVGNNVRVYGSYNAKDITNYAANKNGYVDLNALAGHHDAQFTVKSGTTASFSSLGAGTNFFNLALSYHSTYGGDFKLFVTEAGNADGSHVKGHQTHDLGRSIDFRYMNSDGQPIQGANAVLEADDPRMIDLFSGAASRGFNQNYSDNNITYKTKWAPNHSNHGHLGQTRPEVKATPPKK